MMLLFFLKGICEDGDIRLVQGQSELEGYVEVCQNEVWGTVCDDHWSTNDATVACQQLGFSPISKLNLLIDD